MADDEIDCSGVVRELYAFLDGEVTEQKRLRVERHMGGCSDCHEVVEFHYQLKVTIAEKCRDRVPNDLRERVLRALDQPPRGPE